MSEGTDWYAIYELVALQKKYLARGTMMSWTIKADPGYEDLSAPELETEYDGGMVRADGVSDIYSWWRPAGFEVWMECAHRAAVALVNHPEGGDNSEINEGFLPSEKGSVWKENEDPEPAEYSTYTMRKDVGYFAMDMMTVLDLHSGRKGESWKTMPIDDLHRVFNKVIHDYWYNEPVGLKDYIDIANVAIMLYWRTKEGDE